MNWSLTMQTRLGSSTRVRPACAVGAAGAAGALPAAWSSAGFDEAPPWQPAPRPRTTVDTSDRVRIRRTFTALVCRSCAARQRPGSVPRVHRVRAPRPNRHVGHRGERGTLAVAVGEGLVDEVGERADHAEPG